MIFSIENILPPYFKGRNFCKQKEKVNNEVSFISKFEKSMPQKCLNFHTINFEIFFPFSLSFLNDCYL